MSGKISETHESTDKIILNKVYLALKYSSRDIPPFTIDHVRLKPGNVAYLTDAKYLRSVPESV